MGCWCAEKAFRRARRRFLMLLACLRFRPRRRTGRAGLRPAEVEGAPPPPVRLRRLRGGRAGAPAGAPQLSLPAGVAPSNQSLRTVLLRTITRALEMVYVVLDDALPPIRSTGARRISLDSIGRQRTCVGPGSPRTRGGPTDDVWLPSYGAYDSGRGGGAVTMNQPTIPPS